MALAGVATSLHCRRPIQKEGRVSSIQAMVTPQDLSYCGLACNACDVFMATQYGDAEALQRALKLWTNTAQQHWGMQTLDPAILRCKGCRTEGAAIFKGCRHCPIRRCAKGRDLASCGLCSAWKGCERLGSVLADEPQARHSLERIAAGSHR